MSGPSISAILPTDSFETVRDAVEALAAQTISDQVELVLPTPAPADRILRQAPLDRFGAVQVVHVDDVHPVYRARVAAVRAASAPVVLFAETHSFPEPGSLEALVERHSGPWAAVGQVIQNGNPYGMVSWTNMFLDYGPWVEAEGGEVTRLPTHNTSFKRDILLSFEDGLESLMESGEVLVQAIRAAGHRLYLEPRARTHHLNVSQPRPWLRERVVAGRAYAARRRDDWPLSRRLAYALGTPLIPLVRLHRVRADMRRTGHAEQLLPGAYPVLAIGLLLSAFGELLGYSAGAGRSTLGLSEIELHRQALLRPGEAAQPVR